MANEFITRRGLISLGGISFPYINRTSSYTITDEDYFIDCSGTFSVTLPTSIGRAGRIFVIKNSGSGTTTVSATASQTIDGVSSRNLVQNQSLTVQSNGANWLVSVDGTGVGATGSGGTLNYVPRWLDSSRLSSTGSIFDDGSNVGIGNTGPSAKLHITATSSTNSFRIRNFRPLTGNYDNLLISSQGLVEINTDGGGGATALSIRMIGGTENFRVQENGIIRFRAANAFDNDTQMSIGVGKGMTFGLNISATNVYDGTNVERNLVSFAAPFSFPSGSNTASAININPTIATVGGSNLIRGLYFNPTIQTTTGSTIRSIETVIGDVYLASSSGNVGIGVAPTSSAKLAVSGTISTTGFRMTTGATAGYVLTSDAFGNASWTASVGGGGSVSLVTSPFSGINITPGTTNSTIDTVYNTSLDPGLTMQSGVGGIPALTTVANLSGKTFVQLFDDLLFPTVNPTYTIPTIVASSNVTGIREIGLTVSPSITLTGTENDAGPYSKLVINKNTNGTGNSALLTVTSTASMTVNTTTAIADQFGFPDPNNPNLTYQIQTSETISVPAPASGGSSTIVYSGTGDYDAGLAKKNNKGVTHSATAAVRTTTAPQAAGTNFGSTTQTITGFYPYFFGKTSTQKTASEIRDIIEAGVPGTYTKVVNAGSGSLSMAFNANGEWPWFAIFQFYLDKTTWFESAFNSGPIGSPTDLFASPTTLTITSPDGYWTVGYKIYPANKVTTITTATIS